MRPLDLTLRGFIGIRSGLNREELRLDLRDYSGLVAIIGPNGYGKTTILDNLHPYRVMPFRAGGYSERQTSYYDETYGEAEKNLIWSLGHRVFGSQLLIHNAGKTKKTEAYLFFQEGDDWKPFVAADGTISDGKAETYDRCVHSLLGPPEMFFTAIFASQERKRLADYAAGDIKLLMSELLSLDHLLDLSKKAAAKATAAQSQIDALQPQIRAHDAAVAEVSAHGTALEQARRALATASQAQAAASEALEAAKFKLTDAQSREHFRAENKRRRDVLQQQLTAVDREIAEARGKLERDLTGAREHGAAAEIARDIEALSTRRTQLLQRLQSAQIRAEGSADAATAARDLTAATAAVEAQAELIVDARAAVELVADAPSLVATLREKKAGLVTAGNTEKKSLQAAKARAALATRVPCAGLPINSTCELLADARTAAAAADQHQEEFDRLSGLYAENDTALSQATARAEEHAAAVAKLRDLETHRDSVLTPAVNAAQARVNAAAAAVELLASIETMKVDLSQVEADLAAKRAQADERATQGRDRATQIQGEYDAAEGGRQQRLVMARDELAAVPADVDANELADAQTAVTNTQAGKTTADGAAGAAEREVLRIEAALSAASKKVEDGKAAVDLLAEVTFDLSQWRLLSKGLGRDGVVALAIDDAGPAISTTANELLLECYGPRFSLRFDTQSETAKGTLKEDFDIRVFDAERGDDKSVTKTSGGERIWINDALTRAIALFKANQSGQTFQALFSDESDGGLDADRKVHSFRMKKRVLQMGGYDVEFCITHTRELWEMADKVIDVGLLRAA